MTGFRVYIQIVTGLLMESCSAIIHKSEEFPPLLSEMHPHPFLFNTGSRSDSTDCIKRKIQRQAATWPCHHVTWLDGVESRFSQSACSWLLIGCWQSADDSREEPARRGESPFCQGGAHTQALLLQRGDFCRPVPKF